MPLESTPSRTNGPTNGSQPRARPTVEVKKIFHHRIKLKRTPAATRGGRGAVVWRFLKRGKRREPNGAHLSLHAYHMHARTHARTAVSSEKWENSPVVCCGNDGDDGRGSGSRRFSGSWPMVSRQPAGRNITTTGTAGLYLWFCHALLLRRRRRGDDRGLVYPSMQCASMPLYLSPRVLVLRAE